MEWYRVPGIPFEKRKKGKKGEKIEDLLSLLLSSLDLFSSSLVFHRRRQRKLQSRASIPNLCPIQPNDLIPSLRLIGRYIRTFVSQISGVLDRVHFSVTADFVFGPLVSGPLEREIQVSTLSF